MRKRVFGRKLKRDKNQRKLLFRSLMNSLILMGKIKTTEAKAKSIKGEIEKLVTKAKVKKEDARKALVARLGNAQAVDKVIAEIGPKFESRAGGYTRILKLGPRVKDGASIVEISWVEEISKTSFKEPKRKTLAKVAKKSSTKKAKEGSSASPKKSLKTTKSADKTKTKKTAKK